jgi:cysteine-rich repeat protein
MKATHWFAPWVLATLATTTLATTTLGGCPGVDPQLDPGEAGGAALGGSGGQGGDVNEDCGDGETTGSESCDDGNQATGDGCRPDCSLEICGDGVIDPGMICLSDPVSYAAPAGSRPGLWPLDGGDDLDLVVWGSTLQIRLASGPGSFGGAVTLAQGAADVAGALLNDDNAIDLAVAQAQTAGAYVNAGDGTFGGLVGGAALMTAATIGVGDLDDDGDGDLCVTGCANGCSNPSSNLDVLLSNGDGSFAPAVSYPAKASAQTLVLDVTGDGQRDVVALQFGEGGTVGVYPGDGSGAVANPIESVVPDNCSLNHMDLGDVDGDGWLDVVVGSGCDAKPAYLLRGNGAGGFSDPISLTSGAGGMVSTQLADLDNDGDLDVITGTLGPAVLFFAGDGSGGFADPSEAVTSSGGQAQLATADLDHDGALDLVVAGADGIRVYLSDP